MTNPLRLAVVLCLAVALCFPALAKPKPKKSPSPSPSPSATPAPGVPGGPPLVPQQPEGSPENIRVDVLMIALPEDKFITLLPDLLDKEKIEKAIPDLLDAVKQKNAVLEGYPVVITKSGQRAVVETVKEIRYPTIEPAPTPDAPPAPDASQSGTTQSGSASSAPTIIIAPAATPAPAPATPAEELDFETRNVGATLEVEPVISSDGQYIDINLAPQHVQFLGFETPPEAGKTEGTTLSQEPTKENATRPVFYTMKVTTSVTLHNGQRLLIAVHKAAQPEGYMEIFILHAETITADK